MNLLKFFFEITRFLQLTAAAVQDQVERVHPSAPVNFSTLEVFIGLNSNVSLKTTQTSALTIMWNVTTVLLGVDRVQVSLQRHHGPFSLHLLVSFGTCLAKECQQ